MIFIPLPFVVAILLGILLVQMLRRDEAPERNLLFVFLIALYALQSVLIGVRWGYGVLAVLPFQAVIAAIIASLSWLSFRGLTGEEETWRQPLQWLHMLPPAGILFFIAFWPEPIALTLILIFAGYGTALLFLALKGPDILAAVRLDGVVRSYRALQITAFALLASALADLIISLDFSLGDGSHSASVVAAGNVIALLILGGAASVASSGQLPARDEQVLPDEGTASEPPAATDEDAATASAVDALMRAAEVYKDTDLNLGRLARRLRMPVRQVSLAINRVHGMSVSQYVNNHRIAEACRLLEETDEPVTRIMFDAGFLTKSNFNREFLRVTGQNPKSWRSERQSVPQARAA